MIRIYSILIILLASISGFAQGFTVKEFTADIYLHKDGYFDVVEKYNIDFTQAKHGIFRDIITKFDFTDENGKVSKREIYISNIDVPGEKFKTNKVFGKQFGDILNIRIGDKNTFVSGNKQYEIRYRVKNALFLTDNLAQLYWNIKTSDWEADFDKINFTIHAPEGASLSSENCFVYSGNTGNTEPSTRFDCDYSGNVFSGKSKVGFYSSIGQDVTVLVKLPKSLLAEANFAPPFWKRYGWIGLLGMALLTIFVFIRKQMRGDKVIAVTSYYPPPGIDPAMAGMLIDNTPDFRDITCLLPYWATKGIINMEEGSRTQKPIKKDLKLVKLKDLSKNIADYESNFFHKIFKEKEVVWVSTLRGVAFESQRLLAKTSDRYYTFKKSKAMWLKLIVLALSWLWAFFSITFLPVIAVIYMDVESPWFIIPIILNFIFFFLIFPFLFAFIVNKIRGKNELGKSIMPELLGFYQFIKIAEIERIKALLKEDPLYFEKTMPYAVAFNMLKEWSAKFDGLILQGPDWYRSSSGSKFTMNSFVSSFNRGISVVSLSTASTSSRSSSSRSSSFSRSGGGSSGGGAGRGGGGSW